SASGGALRRRSAESAKPELRASSVDNLTRQRIRIRGKAVRAVDEAEVIQVRLSKALHLAITGLPSNAVYP
ncbi:hypothetical protein CF327_g7730, partial [Tilletia walkeri]